MTQLFSGFPKIDFDGILLTDITVRLDIIRKIKNNVSLFEYVQIPEGKRPEDIAYLAYGNADLYWVVLMLNDMVNTYTDWPMTDDELNSYMIEKYGAENLYDVHHYETTSSSDLGEGVWVDAETPFSAGVSNYIYEVSLNEAKRKIKLIRPEYIAQVLQEYRKELR